MVNLCTSNAKRSNLLIFDSHRFFLTLQLEVKQPQLVGPGVTGKGTKRLPHCKREPTFQRKWDVFFSITKQVCPTGSLDIERPVSCARRFPGREVRGLVEKLIFLCP